MNCRKVVRECENCERQEDIEMWDVSNMSETRRDVFAKRSGFGTRMQCLAEKLSHLQHRLTISHICFPCFPLQHLGQGIWWVRSTDLQRSFSVVSAPCVERCKADTCRHEHLHMSSHGVHTVFALGHERYGVPVDVWALACTLYEIFTGKTLLQASQQVLALCVAFGSSRCKLYCIILQYCI